MKCILHIYAKKPVNGEGDWLRLFETTLSTTVVIGPLWHLKPIWGQG